MSDLITQFLGGINTLGTALLLILLHKAGILKMFLNNKNGKDNNGEQIQNLQKQITAIEENHLHEIQEKLNKIDDTTREEVFYLKQILEEIKRLKHE